MAGVKPLRMIQLGREATPGTKVVTTTKWRGMGTLEDQREVQYVEEDVGLLIPTANGYIPFLAGAISFEATPLTFEQFPHVGDAGIVLATPTVDGAGSGYLYNYPFPVTAQPTIQTYTIEGGDNAGAEVMEYAFVEEFTLSGAAKEAWMLESSWLGRQVAPQAFTGSVALPTVENALFQKTKLYIDDGTGTFGTTLKSSTLRDASLKVTTGWVAAWTADGNLYFSFHKNIGVQAVLEITFEHDGTSIAEKAAWRALTDRLIQLKIEGSALTTAGTYSVKTILIDLAGKWTKFDKLDEQSGNDIVKGTFTGGYNTTQAGMGRILVVNQLSSMP